MTFRLDEFPGRTKIQFVAHNEMPSLIYRACLRTGTCSNTVYIQHAVCEALARDLGLDLAVLLDALPPPRGPANHLFDPTDGHPQARYGVALDPAARHAIGPANTIEEVR
jgi:hypothetical protein